MNNRVKCKWNIEVTKYNKGIFLLGANFNTNDDFEDRESYVCLYLGKLCVTIGKFHKW